ncbi:hypothetical protein MRB53_025843 [Persea americana]|uniref:Uncharacterized protein n=1 Tax=Persea americana TaxID=3435 RepID=A0ACC2LHC9_PERAE|nr:hypothetical protein MRB53_025843 [Persea americana]
MLIQGAAATFVRYFSRKRSPNLRKINPKVQPQEASVIAKDLYQIIKSNGPLTVPKTWDHVKEAGINGLNSKTHMKIMLKWMRGRKMLKLFCTHIGSIFRGSTLQFAYLQFLASYNLQLCYLGFFLYNQVLLLQNDDKNASLLGKKAITHAKHEQSPTLDFP